MDQVRSNLRSNQKPEKVYRSLFSNRDQYDKAEKLLEMIMTWKINECLPSEPGEILIEDVIKFVSNNVDGLHFLDFEHIVEIYLKQRSPLFFIKEEKLQSLRAINAGRVVEPPETLYFGTIKAIAKQIMDQGLMSQRHPYVILTDNFNSAMKKSVNFARKGQTDSYIIEVSAKAAYDKGTEFIMGDRGGLYKSPYISKQFVLGARLNGTLLTEIG